MSFCRVVLPCSSHNALMATMTVFVVDGDHQYSGRSRIIAAVKAL